MRFAALLVCFCEPAILSGGDRFSSITHLKALPGAWGGVPKIRALFETTYFAGLRKAGMAEE